MVEVDLTSLIITVIAGIGIPLILFSMKGFRNTAEGTLTGTIRLEGLKSNVDETKIEMQKGFERLESLLSRRDEKVDKMFSDVHNQIERLSQKVVLNDYRLSSLERSRVSHALGQHDKEDDYNRGQGEGGDNNNG